ncbi:hypothetical protein H4R26_004828 [Coemansia thaxteri]|uniref:SHSP domain-containing protein n=1 Tax=Coemansia thaxteri TaxID=2663907 RepID=A0A9W8EDM8_9FUNG|nr:hypothetical protein H4R26_004828 [Coemansia thaxteri]KAJ2477294.1 hypothetical protein EV174_004666 [Coemansia sp. RSA 2320]
MSMFSHFDKDLKKADGCLHKAADMFFHPIGEDMFHKWDTKHPAFPTAKLTKVTLECKEAKKEEKKEEKKCTCCKPAPPPPPAPAPPKPCPPAPCHPAPCHPCPPPAHHHGCSGHGCCCRPVVVMCHCCPAPAPPPPPAPAPPAPTVWRVYPCFKVLDKYKVEATEWHPMMKDYTADKVWQLHVYLPDVAKDKIMVDIHEGTVVVHGEGIFHTHCGMWPGHVEHCCDCTRKEPTPFVKQFKLPDKCKLKDAFVEFEKEVMVVRILRG